MILLPVFGEKKNLPTDPYFFGHVTRNKPNFFRPYTNAYRFRTYRIFKNIEVILVTPVCMWFLLNNELYNNIISIAVST